MTDKNALTSGLLGDQSNLEMMVPQITKEGPKKSEELPFVLPFTIQETQNNKEERGIMDITAELKKVEIHQYEILGKKMRCRQATAKKLQRKE